LLGIASQKIDFFRGERR